MNYEQRTKINRNQISKIMDKGLKNRKRFLSERRNESTEKYLNELKKQKSFDKSLINQNSKKTTLVESNQKYVDEFEKELQQIIMELENV